MTSEFHPLSQKQPSAVTTEAGCQGDPLCLSIKEELRVTTGADLQNKHRIRRRKQKGRSTETENQQHTLRAPSGCRILLKRQLQEKEKKRKKKQTHLLEEHR